VSNIRFITNNIVDTSALTANPEGLTNYKIDNVKNINRAESFRSSTIENQTIDIVPSSPTNINSIVLGRHNFSDKVNYSVTLYSDQFITPIESFGPTPVQYFEAATDLWYWCEFKWGAIPWGGDKLANDNRKFYNIVLWLDQLYENVAAIRIILSPESTEGGLLWCNNQVIYCNDQEVETTWTSYGTGSGDIQIPYYEIGRIYIGEYESPAYNLSYGHGLQWKENTSQYRPSSGTLQSDIVTANKEVTFSLNTIPESDRATLHKNLVDLSKHDDFFMSIFPEDTSVQKQIDYRGIFKFTKVPKYRNTFCGFYKADFVAEEV
jgi:hypothetical protein